MINSVKSESKANVLLYTYSLETSSSFILFYQIKWFSIYYVFVVNELTTEGKNAIDSPGSPALPDLLPEDYILGKLVLIFNICTN